MDRPNQVWCADITYLLPGDLERQIGAFVEYYNNQRYHESLRKRHAR